jgi:dipeptidyl aminopeptidase/acylaminoacyl peptidase
MTAAAQRILQLESDHTTPASQLALLVLLEDRVRRMAVGGAAEQRQVVDLLKMYLDAEPEIGLAREASELALAAGKTLERRNPALAAEAYRSFASLISERKDAKLSETAKAMEEATRRLGSLPICIVLADGGGGLGGIRRFGYASNWYTACSPDGRFIAAGGYGGEVYLWEVATGKEVHRFMGHRNNVNGVAFSPDGRYLLSGGHDSTMRLWDLETGKEIRKFQGHTGWIFGVAFSPDGRMAVSSSADWSPKPDNSLRLWDVRSGAELKRFEGHKGPILSVAFLPDGRRILSGSDDSSVRLWSVETGKELRAYMKHATAVRCVAVSSDGRFALSGGNADYGKLEPAIQRGGERVVADAENCIVCVWDIESGQLLRQLRGHEGGVHSAAFSRDGRYALSGSGGQHASIGFVPAEDNTVRLWDVQSGRELLRIVSPNSVHSVAIPPEGRFVVFAAAHQPVTLVPLPEELGSQSSGVPRSQPPVNPPGDLSPKLPAKPETKVEPARKKP